MGHVIFLTCMGARRGVDRLQDRYQQDRHPDKNWQAKAYTVGCFQRFPKLDSIEFVFFIPQRNEILSHTFYRHDLDELVDELSAVILQAEKVRPKWEEGTPDLSELTPTVNCRFCQFEDVCPALGGLVVEVAKR